MTAVAHEEEFDALEHVCALLERGDGDALRDFLTGLPHPSDVAVLLEQLDDDDRATVFSVLSDHPALAAEALAEMEPEEHPEESLAALEPAQIAAVVAELSDDDAADLIAELDPEDQDRVLAALSTEDAGEIRELMRYDEASAGGIMTTELVVVRSEQTAFEAIDEIRRQSEETEDFYVVFVVDGGEVLQGFVPLKSLVTARRGARVADLVETVPAVVQPETEQEEVARIVSRYNLTVVPVVDSAGRLLGGVTFDDVIDVIEAENTRDLLGFGGTSQEEELRGGWWEAVSSRLPWLGVNLVTAFAAASVVVAYEGTVAALPLLAAWMPVIAGMGGNTGTQALAVTVRRLALTHEPISRHWGIIGKEILVGATNGAVIGASVAAWAWFVNGKPMLGLVVLLAMWGNLAVAGFAGSFVPVVLERFGIDPAIASSIFVTTFTDMCGFFLLLGLASQLLL